MSSVRLKKFSGTASIVLATSLLLAGCGGGDSRPADGDTPEGLRVINNNESPWPDPETLVFNQVVENGQTVTCVWAGDSQKGGLSCNWGAYNDELITAPKSDSDNTDTPR